MTGGHSRVVEIVLATRRVNSGTALYSRYDHRYRLHERFYNDQVNIVDRGYLQTNRVVFTRIPVSVPVLIGAERCDPGASSRGRRVSFRLRFPPGEGIHEPSGPAIR